MNRRCSWIASSVLRLAPLALSIGVGCAATPARATEEEVARAATSKPKTAPNSERVQVPADPADAGAASCGKLGCRIFASPADAFLAVLEAFPIVLAVGEAHAQKGTQPVASATRRFTEQLLPLLRARATDLVLEIWVAEGKCGKAERRVAEQQKPITETQAQQNPNEFVTLAKSAQRLGIRPHPLRASCDEYEQIAQAGSDDIFRMLELVSILTEKQVRRLLGASVQDAGAHLVVTYGGAIHNDIQPRAGRETWSFGPNLSSFTNGRYVELDLIVPEYIQNTDVWRAQSWYPHFDKRRFQGKTVLFNPSPASYVLIFPSGG